MEGKRENTVISPELGPLARLSVDLMAPHRLPPASDGSVSPSHVNQPNQSANLVSKTTIFFAFKNFIPRQSYDVPTFHCRAVTLRCLEPAKNNSAAKGTVEEKNEPIGVERVAGIEPA
jgi:hypothetical protein